MLWMMFSTLKDIFSTMVMEGYQLELWRIFSTVENIFSTVKGYHLVLWKMFSTVENIISTLGGDISTGEDTISKIAVFSIVGDIQYC